MAKGKAYYAVGGFEVSEDNKMIAYGVDEVSRRQYTLHFKNLETGEILKDAIINTTGSAVFANDNKTVFYTAKNAETLLTEKIKRHVLGSAATDAIVYDEKDKSNYIGVYKSKNDKYIFITTQATLSAEIKYIDAATPMADFKVFQPRNEKCSVRCNTIGR